VARFGYELQRQALFTQSYVALLSAEGRLVIYQTVEGAPSRRVVSTSEPLAPLLWVEDDWLYVQHIGSYTQIPTRISRFHLATGALQP
jgi:hypothetical protein